METFPMHILDEPAEAEWQWLEERINQFNMHLTGYLDYRPLTIVLRDPTGTIMAGLTAFTWGGTLRILTLWVQEPWRKHGYGTQLLAAAEQEARTRGCQQAVVETHSFQAPAFYPARGYTVCGVTPDYPIGYQHLTFQKSLKE